MTWTSHHRRGEVLRVVISIADERLDGRLPLDVAGVAETFGDELTLLGALQLCWHTRLAGHIEKQLADQPLDLENAVVLAWLDTADEKVMAIPLKETTGGFADDGTDLCMKLCWHEGWHVGQIATLRRALGLPGVM